MISIEQLLEKKGHQVWTVSTDSSVFDCIKIMDNKNVGALFVMQKDTMVGIISERDYTRKVILKDRSSKDTNVTEIMTKNLVTIHQKKHVDECLALMSEKQVRHLPVLDGTHLVGMISIGDAVKEIIEDQTYMIHRLEDNISWSESY